MKKTKEGFTLIELLVVIAIIGLLSTLSIIALNSARAKARDAKRISDVKQMQVALELYYNDNNDYPTSTAVVPGAMIGPTSSPYLRSVPTPPAQLDGTCTPATGGYQNGSYAYYATNSNTQTDSYAIYFCLGSQVNDVTAGVHYISPSGIF